MSADSSFPDLSAIPEHPLQPDVNRVCRAVTSGGLEVLGEPDRVLYLVWSVIAEITNGGFVQFFFNLGGEHAHETLAALRIVGAESCAELLERAIALFPDRRVPTGSDERNAAMEAMDGAADRTWEELDRHFFARDAGAHDDIVLDQLTRWYRATP